MSRIFLSHSSANNAEAVALADWLKAEGWEDVFLDVDRARGIVAGERWERALNQAAHRCEAVLFLVTRAWLASEWCLKEFNLAHRLNKRLFGILIEDIPVADLPPTLAGTWQIVQLAAGRDHVMLRVVLPISGDEAHVTFSAEGLARLKAGLQRAGLDARFFAWPPGADPDRPPYRGLRPLEGEDAGIFFGRDAPIVETLDRLRGLASAAAPRFLAILGASGAGKSSFLRAGLIPRLQRDDANFTVLPVLRPERAPITGENGLVRCLEAAMHRYGLKQTRAEMRRAVEGGAKTLTPLFAALAAATQPPAQPGEQAARAPVFVLAIDQGEELFLAENKAEAEALLTLLRDLLLAETPDLIVVVTIRSDAYEQLQTAKILEDIVQQTLSLPPMPRGAYQAVIEGPAKRLRDTPRALKIEPALTAALLSDIDLGGGRDALPLLAFTLERLYLEYGGRGALKLADYEALGRIGGSIEAAVERALTAADSAPNIARDRATRLMLLRSGLVPALASIDPETGNPRRRVARMTEIPAESRPLIELLVDQRLLATDVAADTGEVTIEPAHEALLRQWTLLRDWLKADAGILTTLESIKRAAQDWTTNARNPAWLTHAGGRLDEAERLKARDDIARHLTAPERDYLTECRASEDAKRREEELRLARERRNLRRARRTLVALLIGVAAALAGAVWESVGTSRREAAVFASEADITFQQGYCDRALRLVIGGLPPPHGASPVAFLARSFEDALSRYVSANGCRFRAALSGHADAVQSAVFSPDSGHVLTASRDMTARIWDVRTGAVVTTFSGHRGYIWSAEFSPSGDRVVTASQDMTARVWDAATGAQIAVLVGHSASLSSASFSPDGEWIVTASDDKTARVWNARTGALVATLIGHDNVMRGAAFSPDGNRILTASEDKTAKLWDAKSGQEIVTLKGHTNIVWSAKFSADGARIVTGSYDNTAKVWDGYSGALIETLVGHEEPVKYAAFSPDGNRIVTSSLDKTARLWDSHTGVLLATLSGHTSGVWSAAFSPDGSRVVTASDDKTARLWNAGTGENIAIFVGHEGIIRRASFSPDGQYVVTPSQDKTARVWDAAIAVQLASFQDHRSPATAAIFSPDGARVVTAFLDRSVQLSDSQSGAPIAWLSVNCTVLRVAFSPDGGRLATGCDDGTARIRDARDGTPLRMLAGHQGPIRSLAFSLDGRRIATASDDHTARVWDAETGATIAILAGHQGIVRSVAFSPDGARIATASDDRTARVWDAATGAAIATLTGHKAILRNAAFSPDGARIATASDDGAARIWDAASGAPLATLAGDAGIVWNAVFSPDGHRLLVAVEAQTSRMWVIKTGALMAKLATAPGGAASAGYVPDGSGIVTEATVTSWVSGARTLLSPLDDARTISGAAFSPDGGRIVTDELVQLWDADRGKLIAALSGPDAFVASAAFSREGARIVTASDDRKARVWDAATGKVEAVLDGHDNIVLDAAFSPDGARVVTASEDGTARVWDGQSGALLDTLVGHHDLVARAAFSPDGKRVVTASWDWSARVWRLDPIVAIAPEAREDYVCRERLIGVQSFTDGEMSNPILVGQEDMRNPCDRAGPLSAGYYWRLARGLSADLVGIFGANASN
jgi:WD40 repeat protein